MKGSRHCLGSFAAYEKNLNFRPPCRCFGRRGVLPFGQAGELQYPGNPNAESQFEKRCRAAATGDRECSERKRTGRAIVAFPPRVTALTMFFVNGVARKRSRGSHNRKMLMKKIAIILVVAGLLSAGCSRKKEETADTMKTSPSPNLQKRMEEQQKAIQRASAQVQKEQDQKAAAGESATPSPSPR
jgi:hypothetical protein